MDFSTHILKTALVPAFVLLPAPGPGIDRAMDRDIDLLQHAECEYRGITASFDEVTRAYILQVYEGGQLLRWQAQPSPYNPETETLVTAVFKAEGQKAPAPTAAIGRIRDESLSGSGITWRYSTLAATRITAHGDFALDAIAVFQETVDAFIDRMVFTPAEAPLRAAATADARIVAQIASGTVLLLEETQERWVRVRRPSSTEAGWLKKDEVQFIGNEHDGSN